MSRRIVNAEINADPSYVLVMRAIRVDTADGGYKDLPRAAIGSTPQQVLIVPAKRRLSDMLINTELGDLPKYPYLLVARHDADFKRGDTFEWRGDDFQVKSVHEKPGISWTIQVDYFGGDHNA